MSVEIPAWLDGRLQPVEKLRAHQLGLKHLAISVFVLHEGRILMQQRALHKYHTPGLWTNTCCTHPNWDETAQACARRRLSEELGIQGLRLQHRGAIEYRADVGQGLIEHELVSIFTADAPQDLALALNPDEVAAVEWLDLETLLARIEATPERFTPWLKIYLDEHAEMIFPKK